MTVFYFTATGNCLAVAKQIGGNLISIPQVIDSEELNFKDDIIGIVFPVFWWNMPVIIRRFLEKAKLEADYIFAIGTHGGAPGGAMDTLQELASKNGYSFDYIDQLSMMDNYLPLFEMDDQLKKLSAKDVDGNLKKIIENIEARKKIVEKSNVVIKLATKVMKRIFKPVESPAKYIVNDKCNKCGICTKVCPTKNISVTGNVTFGKNCEMCLACLHLCPENALHHKKQKSEKRWLNPNVSLTEIIEANNR